MPSAAAAAASVFEDTCNVLVPVCVCVPERLIDCRSKCLQFKASAGASGRPNSVSSLDNRQYEEEEEEETAERK